MRRAVGPILAALALCSCEIVLDLGDKVYSPLPTRDVDGGSGSDGGRANEIADANVGASEAAAGPLVCPTGKGAAMVAVGGLTCVDATEVTQAQYAAFLAATGNGLNVGGQPAQCSANTTYKPGGCSVPAAGAGCAGAACDAFPQTCVDWCDAFAYCAWAGKRLCGSPAGGPASLSSITDPTTSQWTAACTSGGKHTYPYGDTYVADRCASGPDLGTLAATATYPECQSKEAGYGGVFDLSGSVSEWEDACEGNSGAADFCRVRGGAYDDTDEFAACAAALRYDRNYVSFTVGFRCCAP